ncbi:MAG: ABC transporter ATP-binding protein [Pseudomonadota bacterium]
MIDKNIAIKIENLGKRYRIGMEEEASDSIGQALFNVIKSPLKNYKKYRSLYNFKDANANGLHESEDVFWAIKGLNFEVKRGEVVGIIGTNGAGKSTLLKILSKITAPTEGHAEIRGRVSSLLEVGTGFHKELTGRENVYMNATILGMRKKEVDKKFDQIVEFSEVEKFLDTPVKRYSMGMRVRLAFAVAAHLEPEILIIDEVLAVGDAAFQRKCLDTMQDVGQRGKTVLFVSHNMAAVARLCQRAILLDQGKIVKDGPASSTVSMYLTGSMHGDSGARIWPDLSSAPGDHVAKLRAVRTVTEDGQSLDGYDIRHPIGLQMEYEVLEEGNIILPYYEVINDDGVRIFAAVDQDPSWLNRPRPRGRYTSTAWIPGNLLSEGVLYITVAMRTLNRKLRRFFVRDAITFNVVDTLEGGSARGEWAGRLKGAVRPLLKWETQYQKEDGDQALSQTA